MNPHPLKDAPTRQALFRGAAAGTVALLAAELTGRAAVPSFSEPPSADSQEIWAVYAVLALGFVAGILFKQRWALVLGAAIFVAEMVRYTRGLELTQTGNTRASIYGVSAHCVLMLCYVVLGFPSRSTSSGSAPTQQAKPPLFQRLFGEVHIRRATFRGAPAGVLLLQSSWALGQLLFGSVLTKDDTMRLCAGLIVAPFLFAGKRWAFWGAAGFFAYYVLFWVKDTIDIRTPLAPGIDFELLKTLLPYIAFYGLMQVCLLLAYPFKKPLHEAPPEEHQPQP